MHINRNTMLGDDFLRSAEGIPSGPAPFFGFRALSDLTTSSYVKAILTILFAATFSSMSGIMPLSYVNTDEKNLLKHSALSLSS